MDKFKNNEIVDSSVGFMSTEDPNNIDPNPSYDQLDSGELGHV